MISGVVLTVLLTMDALRCVCVCVCVCVCACVRGSYQGCAAGTTAYARKLEAAQRHFTATLVRCDAHSVILEPAVWRTSSRTRHACFADITSLVTTLHCGMLVHAQASHDDASGSGDGADVGKSSNISIRIARILLVPCSGCVAVGCILLYTIVRLVVSWRTKFFVRVSLTIVLKLTHYLQIFTFMTFYCIYHIC